MDGYNAGEMGSRNSGWQQKESFPWKMSCYDNLTWYSIGPAGDGNIQDFIRPVEHKLKEVWRGGSKISKKQFFCFLQNPNFPARSWIQHKPHPLLRVNDEAHSDDGLHQQEKSATLLLFPHRGRNRNKTKDLHCAETLMWKICPKFKKRLVVPMGCVLSGLSPSSVGR